MTWHATLGLELKALVTYRKRTPSSTKNKEITCTLASCHLATVSSTGLSNVATADTISRFLAFPCSRNF